MSNHSPTDWGVKVPKGPVVALWGLSRLILTDFTQSSSNIDWLVNWNLFASAQLSLHHNHPLILLPSPENKTPRGLETATLWQPKRSNPMFFWQRTMTSNLEVLTLMLASSHSARNRHSACQRSCSDEAKKIPCHLQKKAERCFWVSVTRHHTHPVKNKLILVEII